MADIDGSGTTDIIYLGTDQIDIYRNQSGNSWSDRESLTTFPAVDNLSAVQAVDLLGNGTACLVWSSPLPADSSRPMRYIDLMGGQKPHLLIKTVNNLGAETEVRYAPSTYFYLKDKRDGKPWVTRLPFPVHVVERVVTHDRISGNQFVTRYEYHHGYFDDIEREFRGFGMVEHWDTEEFAALNASGQVPAGTNVEAASHVPPVRTKTWFHTGVYLGRNHVSDYFAGLLNATDQGEYFREPGLTDDEARALLLPDTVLPSGLILEEEREACRALKGSMLRQEVYADDADHPGATPEQIQRARTPYTVTEQNFSIRALQPRGTNRHAVFYTHGGEAISYHYERDPTDPRIQHALTLEVDDYDNVLKQAAIGYGRCSQIRVVDTQGNVQMVPNPGLTGLQAGDQARQITPLLTYTENRVTNAINSADTHRNPLPCEALTFELTGYVATGLAGRFQASDLVEPDPATPGRLRHKFAAPEVAYETTATGNQRRRPIEWLRTLYRRDDLASPLPLGELQSLALPFENYKLAFTPGLVAEVYGGRASDAMLANEGRYVHTEGDTNWWIPSGQIFYSPNSGDNAVQELAFARQNFFLPHRYRDPFHTNTASTESFVAYDIYDLLVHETRDALGNQVTVGERQRVLPDGTVLPEKRCNDYRVLQPALVMDPNRNRSAVAFDALGMVVGTAVMGKPEENPRPGDVLDDSFQRNLTEAQIKKFIEKPREPSANPRESVATQIVHDLLGSATTRIVYDLDRYKRSGEPTFAAAVARETHISDLQADQTSKSKLQVSFSYSDGFGREIQKKIQAEAGPVPQRDADGKIIVGPDGQPVMTPNDVSPRWVGSGWTIFNNKGKPVRQYEPFFTDTHRFEFDVHIGVSPVLFYDPVERVVATLHPNHTWEKVIFDPWRQETWDVNDTVLMTDPKTDADVGDFFCRLPEADYLPTWHALRTDPTHATEATRQWPDLKTRDAEKLAAEKTSVHAATPTVAHADTLGRTFAIIAHNKFNREKPDGTIETIEEKYATRIQLDIEGNQREVKDAKDRIVMRYDYDMLSNRIHQASMEAGERWMLNDVPGKPLYAWDSRNHRFRTAYDPLRRPTDSFLSEGGGAEMRVGQTIYGEAHPNYANPETRNLRGKVVEVRDQAGIVTSDEYDFKGNLLHSQRQLAELVESQGTQIPAYKTTVDWSVPVQLEAAAFTNRTRYDALNRPIQSIAPHSNQPATKINVIQPGYNEANLLERVDVWLERTAEPDTLLDPAAEASSPVGVANIDYDAKGQRKRIDYKNGASTFYDYDSLTFRLTHLYTRRGAAFTGDCDNPNPPPPTIAPPDKPPDGKACGLQNLHYTFDPVGNITHIRDDAQQTIYFRNKCVEPSAEYTYDAIYRLIEATGREHLGQAGGSPMPHSYNDSPRVGLLHPADGTAMGLYLERYVYDSVGNFLSMKHRGTDPVNVGWNRDYTYNEPSQLELSKQSNRLTSTTIGGTTETYSRGGDGYDAHGNMPHMPHLQVMQWDFKDQLQMTQRQKVNDEDADGMQHLGERTWYVYDSAGQRVRKATERQTAAGQTPKRKQERIYLGALEIYREYDGTGSTVMLERETLQLMGGKQRIALVETRTQGNDPAPQQLIRYQFGDHLGSASLELDDQAQIISYEEYTPYGSTSYQAVRSQTETPKRYRYTGKERDEESGLYYHGARYYAPWIGRWTSHDPSGLKDDVNGYVVNHNNPIVFIDSNGKDAENRVAAAKKLIGTPYRKELVSTLRTENTPAALEYMDCSEFVSRVLAADNLMKNEGYNTEALKKFFETSQTFQRSETPTVGDVALWKGHTEIVSAVKDEKIRTIGAHSPEIPAGETKGFYSATESKRHSTFYGFYRPSSENKAAPAAQTQEGAQSRNGRHGWTVIYNGMTATVVDEQAQFVAEFGATSGRPGFSGPESQGLKDKGPIPEGVYTFDAREFSEGGFLRNLLGDWGGVASSAST